DVAGARLTPLARAYDRVTRGGITNIRMSQYSQDVVRIVLDLDAPHNYTVTRGESTIRVSLESNVSFAAWHSAETSPVATAVADSAPTVEKPAKTVVSDGQLEQDSTAKAV